MSYVLTIYVCSIHIISLGPINTDLKDLVTEIKNFPVKLMTDKKKVTAKQSAKSKN